MAPLETNKFIEQLFSNTRHPNFRIFKFHVTLSLNECETPIDQGENLLSDKDYCTLKSEGLTFVGFSRFYSFCDLDYPQFRKSTITELHKDLFERDPEKIMNEFLNINRASEQIMFLAFP